MIGRDTVATAVAAMVAKEKAREAFVRPLSDVPHVTLQVAMAIGGGTVAEAKALAVMKIAVALSDAG